MTKDMVQDIFSGYRSIGEWNAENYWEKVEGRNALIEFGGTKNSKKSKGYFAINTGNIPLENESYFQNGLYDFKGEKLDYKFRRLSAERNIVLEKEGDLDRPSTGEGASNLVRVFLNDSTYDEKIIDKTEILDDLDIKASDILQANGIIWVEGPSDRIYIKKWLEIFCNNQFEEGKHYQFLYYGGRLLSQYSAEEETDLISIITTNRNAAIVMDSDKKNQDTPLSGTKERIIEEFNKLGMFSWVTEGKEIENYIPKEAVKLMSGKAIRKKCEKYDLFPDYINTYYKNFEKRKCLLQMK